VSTFIFVTKNASEEAVDESAALDQADRPVVPGVLSRADRASSRASRDSVPGALDRADRPVVPGVSSRGDRASSRASRASLPS